MRTKAFGILALLCCMMTAPAYAASTSPGKSSAFESMTTVLLVPSPSPLLMATIVKSKKKTVLKVEAMYTDGPYSPTPPTTRVLGLVVTVNGVLMNPSTAGAAAFGEGTVIDCGFSNPPPAVCAASGTWWLDIDAAEAANPGLFVNQPLMITLTGGDLTGGALVGVQNMDVALSAIVVKK